MWWVEYILNAIVAAVIVIVGWGSSGRSGSSSSNGEWERARCIRREIEGEGRRGRGAREKDSV